jgi:uncharacterized protein DUF5906
MTDNYHTDVRLQLLANGYAILPNTFKACLVKGWNAPDWVARELTSSSKGSGADKIARWPKRFPDAKTTGVRIENGLGVTDIDIDDEKLSQIAWDVIAMVLPEVFARAPVRYGGGTFKAALFMRIIGEPFGRIASRRYNGGHMVEIYGGAKGGGGRCARQFGIYGPHSEGRDYLWADHVGDLAAQPLGDLPAGSRDKARAVVDAFDAAAIAAGYVPDPLPDAGEGGQVYDIDDQTRFDTDRAGSGLSYEELCEAHAAMGDLRCSSSFMAGREGTRRDRAWVFHSPRHDCVAVFVYGDETTHYPADRAPHPERVIEALKSLNPPADRGGGPDKNAEGREPPSDDGGLAPPPEPDAAAPVNEKAAWLLASYGYCMIEDTVVELFAAHMACHIRPAAFDRQFRRWFEPPSGRSRKPVFATELWSMASLRLSIAGVRMRPDRPFPVFEEGGRLFKNTYRPPAHPLTGGDSAKFMEFLHLFIPDPVEREFLLNWMAHKLRRPDVPGTSLVFVADNQEGVREGRFGTGRGLMFRVAHALYGPQYARAQAFSVLDGTSGQSGFTDWMHGNVLVTVDESRTSPTAYRRGERNAVYDVLKDIVDPAPKRMTFTGKYRQAFDGMSYCSFWIASNHADAVAIPEADRRFSVLRNGRALTPDEAIAIDRWMGDPANIGALARMLAARDLSGFNMFQPLMTAAKAEMADLALSDVEGVLRDMMAETDRGLVFTRAHLQLHVGHHYNVNDARWHGEFAGAWNRYCIKVTDPATGAQRRVRSQGTQKKLFCFRSRRAEAERLPEAACRREAAKWGAVDGETRLPDLTMVQGLTKKDEEDQ